MIAKSLGVVALLAGALTMSANGGADENAPPGCAAALAYSRANNGLAVLVLVDGKAVCRSLRTDEPHELWSGTKSLVGLIAAAAVQDGLLKLDEPASDTLTEWRRDPQKTMITIRQLLSMTGGQATTIGRPLGYADSVKAALTSAPGTQFQYGPAPMQIFGEILRRKLDKAGQDANPRRYAERRILGPAGVKVAEWRNGADGLPLMPQGMILAADEWVKLGELVRRGGRVGGKPIVDPDAFAQLFRGSTANPAYGLTWWLPRSTPARDFVTRSTDIPQHAAELPADMVVAAGAGDQRLYVIPSRKMTIVRQAALDLRALATGKPSGWSDARFLALLLGGAP